jgi:hypothetical protein
MLCNIDDYGLAWFFRDKIVSAVVLSAPPREPVHMAAARPEESDTSDRSDDMDLSFGFALQIDAAEYSRIMRRIPPSDDEGTVTPISAFNSAV